MTSKDLFSTQSKDYAKFRPTYPDSLLKYLASLTPEHRLVWDCGTGNGQSALLLAEYYDHVIATDPSEKQLASAVSHPKIEYCVGSAEKSGLENKSVDLITVAQAFHWFDQPAFFSEVRRVLKPSGALAIWTYAMAKITPEVDEAVLGFYSGVLNAYWEKERTLVEEGYRNISFPFKEITPPDFKMSEEWSFEHLIGYLGTWSALQSYIKINGMNPLIEYAPTLEKAWGAVKARPITWGLALRVGFLNPG